MVGSRYPITEIGIEKMVTKLIQKGERDRQAGDCDVEIDKDAEVDGVRCTRIRVKHPVKKTTLTFISLRFMSTKNASYRCAIPLTTGQQRKGRNLP